MSKETTYAGMLGSWQRWIATLLANGSDLGHLQVLWEQLGTLAARGQELMEDAIRPPWDAPPPAVRVSIRVPARCRPCHVHGQPHHHRRCRNHRRTR